MHIMGWRWTMANDRYTLMLAAMSLNNIVPRYCTWPELQIVFIPSVFIATSPRSDQLVRLHRRTTESERASETSETYAGPGSFQVLSNCRHRQRRPLSKVGAEPASAEKPVCACGLPHRHCRRNRLENHRRPPSSPPLARSWWRWIRDCLVTTCSDCEIILRQWMRCTVVSGMARLLLTFYKNKGDKKKNKSAEREHSEHYAFLSNSWRMQCTSKICTISPCQQNTWDKILVKARYRHDWGSTLSDSVKQSWDQVRLTSLIFLLLYCMFHVEPPQSRCCALPLHHPFFISFFFILLPFVPLSQL